MAATAEDDEKVSMGASPTWWRPGSIDGRENIKKANLWVKVFVKLVMVKSC